MSKRFFALLCCSAFACYSELLNLILNEGIL